MIEPGTVAYYRATLALALGSFLVFANLYTPQPLLPMLADAFSVSALKASWLLTISTFTLGLSLLVYGPLSDSIGRKGIMVVTIAGATASTALIATADHYNSMLLLRALQGAMLGGLPAIAIAYMGEEFSPRALMVAVGLYISANSLGGISGRLIGGALGDRLGYADTFLVMAAFDLVMLLVFAWLLPPSRQFRARKLRIRRVRQNLRRHLTNPELNLAYIIGGFNFFIFVNQYSYATFLLSAEPYALSSSLLGLLFLTYLSGTFSSAMSGKVAHYFSQPLCMAIGIVLMIGGSLVTLLPTIWAILGGFLVSAFGFFFAHSSASSWVSRNAKFARASASSLYLVFYYLGASLGGIYLDPFWNVGGWTGVIGGSVFVLCCTLFAALTLNQRHLQAKNILLSSTNQTHR